MSQIKKTIPLEYFIFSLLCPASVVYTYFFQTSIYIKQYPNLSEPVIKILECLYTFISIPLFFFSFSFLVCAFILSHFTFYPHKLSKLTFVAKSLLVIFAIGYIIYIFYSLMSTQYPIWQPFFSWQSLIYIVLGWCKAFLFVKQHVK